MRALPVPGQQLIELAHGLTGDASEHVGQPGLRIDVVELGGRLSAPKMQQVRMNVVPASDFDHGRISRQTLLDNSMLLCRRPTPPPFRTWQTVTVDIRAIDVQVNG